MFPSAVNVISAEASNWSIVALSRPWMCIPRSVAVRLATLSSPEPAPSAVMVSSLAFTSMVRKSRAASGSGTGTPGRSRSAYLIAERRLDLAGHLVLGVRVGGPAADHEHQDDHDQRDERPSPAPPPRPGRRRLVPLCSLAPWPTSIPGSPRIPGLTASPGPTDTLGPPGSLAVGSAASPGSPGHPDRGRFLRSLGDLVPC